MKIRIPILAFATRLLACAGSVATLSVNAAPFFVELGQRVDNLHGTGSGRFAVLDVDGDGLDDLVFSAWTAFQSNLFVVGRRPDGTLGFKQAAGIPDERPILRVLAWPHAGTTHVITVSEDGMARDYSGWPLAEQRAFPVEDLVARTAVVGDVDNDGADELIVGTYSGLFAYSMVTGAPKWTYNGSGAGDLVLAQLDADPALEIIVSDFPGLVLDGATLATEWEIADGLLPPLASGLLAMEGGTQWIGRLPGGTEFGVFGASPWSQRWNRDMQFVIGAATAVNLDGEGTDEILVGHIQSGFVAVVDSITHENRLTIPFSADATSAVAGADLDGDGAMDIAISAVGADVEDPVLIVADGSNGQRKWQFVPTAYPYSAAESGDLNGDGRLETAAFVGDGLQYGDLAVFDAYSGAEIWRSQPGNGFNGPFDLRIRNLTLVAKPLSTGMDIVLAGSQSQGGRISVVDGTTRQSILQIGASNPGPMPNRHVNDIAVFDFNGDGVNDYVAATTPYSSDTTGALLYVFSGANGSLLWTSPAMGGAFADIYSVFVTDHPTGQPGKEMVAVLPDSLRSYNSSTGLLSWVLAVDNTGAIFIPQGLAGPEFGVISGPDTISFTTRQPGSYCARRPCRDRFARSRASMAMCTRFWRRRETSFRW